MSLHGIDEELIYLVSNVIVTRLLTICDVDRQVRSICRSSSRKLLVVLGSLILEDNKVLSIRNGTATTNNTILFSVTDGLQYSDVGDPCLK
jgi:hypothetical protein